MSRRSQRLDILTAAGLAESERDREIREGQRDAANTSRWAGALSSLIPAGIDGAGKAYGAAEDNAVNKATAYAAEHADVADVDSARGLVDANPELSETGNGGILDNLMGPIRSKARATAATALTSSAKANTASRENKAAAAAENARQQGNVEADRTIRADETRAQREARESREKIEDDRYASEREARERQRAEDIARDEANRRADRGQRAADRSETRADRLARDKERADERAAAAAASAKAKEDGRGKLTAGETEGIVELQTGLSMLDRVATLKNSGGKNGEPIDTGPIASLISWGSDKVGTGDPRMVEFKATVGAQLSDYIKSISGATVGDAERAALLQNVPTPGDNDEAFMAKLASVKAQLENKLSTKRRAYEAMDKDTRVFTPAPAAAAPTAKKTRAEALARVGELKAQGVPNDQIKAQMRKEGF